MIVVIPFANPDVRQAIELLEWINLLGGVKGYRCLLVADAATDCWKSMKALGIARQGFNQATLITNENSIQGWPQGANSLFFTASNYVREVVKEPFVWLEPDAIPVKAGWLDALAAGYMAQPQKLFMGCIYSCDTPGLPPRLMSGIAVYPPYEMFVTPVVHGQAWDVTYADQMINFGKHTNLINHFWGQPRVAPIFSEVKAHDSPPNTFTLKSIPEEAVIFHRNKDGSLIRLLKNKLFPNSHPPLLVVIPFCGKDVECAMRNVRWIAEMGRVKAYHCLLSYDDQTRRESVNEIVKVASAAFQSVQINAYRLPGNFGWPEGANRAFQQAAAFIQNNHKVPWLWLEADAVPLKPTWLDELSTAYANCGRSFFGPIVPNRDHQNGVMVYPWNAAERLPRAMSAVGVAWDYVCTPDMIHDRADASHLIQHCWGSVNGAPHPTEGEPLRFNSVDDVLRWVQPQAVIFHRSKFPDLTNFLRQTR